MLETENIEEVITSSPHDDEAFGLSSSNFENSSEMTHQFLSVQDSVFNPVTGTLQPISSVMASTTQTPTPPPPKPKKAVKQQVF